MKKTVIAFFAVCVSIAALMPSTSLGANEAAFTEISKMKGDAIYGYESVEQYGFVPGFSTEIVEARCSDGKKVLGGGWTFLSGGDWEAGDLGPSPDGGGYYLSMRSLSEEPQEVLVTAICAFVSKKSK